MSTHSLFPLRIPVCLPGKSHGQKTLAGYSPWGHKESDTTEVTWHAQGSKDGGGDLQGPSSCHWAGPEGFSVSLRETGFNLPFANPLWVS